MLFGLGNYNVQIDGDGNNMPSAGTHNTSHTYPAALMADANYVVQVTNKFGSITSSNAVLSIYSSAVPTMNAVSFYAGNGFQFTVVGVPGFNYAVETSTNLIDWTPLITNGSPFNFVDTNTDFPQRFYRGIYLP